MHVIYFILGFSVLNIFSSLFFYIRKYPQYFPRTYIGKTLFVFKHQKNVATLIPLEEWKGSRGKGRKFYTPPTWDQLTCNTPYKLCAAENGELYLENVD